MPEREHWRAGYTAHRGADFLRQGAGGAMPAHGEFRDVFRASESAIGTTGRAGTGDTAHPRYRLFLHLRRVSYRVAGTRDFLGLRRASGCDRVASGVAGDLARDSFRVRR